MPPRVLIGILSCRERRARADAQRRTWLLLVHGADYRFFLGRGDDELENDEARLDTPEGHHNLLLKTLGTVRYALAHGYDYLFKCDDDTYVVPQDLVIPAPHDYVGNTGLSTEGPFYAAGGGYWLSRRAMQFLIDSPEEKRYRKTLWDGLVLMPEDFWVYTVLREHGIPCRHDARYSDKRQAGCGLIASWEFSPEEMLAEHERRHGKLD